MATNTYTAYQKKTTQPLLSIVEEANASAVESDLEGVSRQGDVEIEGSSRITRSQNLRFGSAQKHSWQYVWDEVW
jgi:hypothetical protein